MIYLYIIRVHCFQLVILLMSDFDDVNNIIIINIHIWQVQNQPLKC